MTTILEATDNTLQLQRIFKASIDRVWAAWTNPNQVYRWFGCPDSKGLGAEIDLKVGGVYSVRMFSHGQEMTMAGKITELDAPRLLKLDWRWEGNDFSELPTTSVKIELAEVAGGTQVTLTHTGFPSADICNEHQKGWTSSMERVGGFVEGVEGELFAVIEAWDEAVCRKDSEAIVKDYLEDATLFDIGTQINGRQAIKELWDQCLPFFGDEVAVLRKDVSVKITGDTALLTCLSRCTGVVLPEGAEMTDMMKSWFRASSFYQRIDGQWKVVHEHISMPMNCMEEKPAYILD